MKSAGQSLKIGVKVRMATTSKGNWVVGGIQSFPDNPYDGHTLEKTLEQVERLTGRQAREVYVDKGYRGHGYTVGTQVYIAGTRRKIKNMTRTFRKWLKRRNAIESIFGHLKSDNLMSRNCLKGHEGDQISALHSGCGFNMRKLLAAFLLHYFVYIKLSQTLKNYRSKWFECHYSFI
jgi:IS5 family transposase